MLKIKKRKIFMGENALKIRQNKIDMNFNSNFLNKEKLLGLAYTKYKNHLEVHFKMP
jgi:hypothetical protein